MVISIIYNYSMVSNTTKKFRSLVTFIFSLFFFGLFSTAKVLAYDTGLGDIESPIDGDIFSFIGNMSSYIRPVIGLAFLAVIIYGGWTRMTAAGNADKEKKSMQIIVAGVVGFIIIVLAPVIVGIVTGLIGLQNNLF